MLTGVHFLLTYRCNFECDHCFLYCGPHAQGTFTLEQLRRVYDEIEKMGTVEWVYFEGGEPFLYYPLMLKGLEMARDSGLKTGVVTNAYWATAVEDAGLWLNPVSALDVSDLSLSDDEFHSGEEEESLAKAALAAAKKLGMPVDTICIEKPVIELGGSGDLEKGAPVVGGGVRLRGRAVDKLAEGLPRRRWEEFNECPCEDLANPKRIHLDSYGNVHICQGLSMGNMWEIPLSVIDEKYDPAAHPVCDPLLKGGPALLSQEYSVDHENTFVDACHFCYLVRLSLIEKFPQYLAPRQVYGLE
jgi:hypothetical protein